MNKKRFNYIIVNILVKFYKEILIITYFILISIFSFNNKNFTISKLPFLRATSNNVSLIIKKEFHQNFYNKIS